MAEEILQKIEVFLLEVCSQENSSKRNFREGTTLEKIQKQNRSAIVYIDKKNLKYYGFHLGVFSDSPKGYILDPFDVDKDELSLDGLFTLR